MYVHDNDDNIIISFSHVVHFESVDIYIYTKVLTYMQSGD